MSDNVNRLQPNARHRDIDLIQTPGNENALDNLSHAGARDTRPVSVNSNVSNRNSVERASRSPSRSPSVNSNESLDLRLVDFAARQPGRQTPGAGSDSDSENENGNESDADADLLSAQDEQEEAPPSHLPTRALVWLTCLTLVISVAGSSSALAYIFLGETDARVHDQLHGIEQR